MGLLLCILHICGSSQEHNHNDDDGNKYCDDYDYFCCVFQLILVHFNIFFQSEVNAIRWDPSGTLLASCSDDMSAKVNSVDDTHKFREKYQF